MAGHRSDKVAAMSEPEDVTAEVGPELDAGAELIRLASEVDPLLSQWARFRDQFAAAMPGGFWTIEDLEQKIAHRRAFFFPGRNAALIGQIEVYPGGERVFQFLWAVGELEEIVQLVPGCEALARMMGCTAMLVEGRPAWKRVLEPQGYALWSITLHKGL
jgi:hypothetical protein